MPLVSAVNVSEGRPSAALDAIVAAAGRALLDVHSDAHHHRSVITVAGVEGVRRVAESAVRVIDLRRHTGVHPRLGAVDVVPFTPFGESTLADALAARDDFAAWSMATLRVPALRYGDGAPTLPVVRRRARRDLRPHPTAGAVAVGARPPLVAYNVWVDADVGQARLVAAAIRSPVVRALGLAVGHRVQVSMNLIEPALFGPGAAYDAVARLAPVVGAELVGLVPTAVLASEDAARWGELDLAADRTVEWRLSAGGPLEPSG